MESASTASKSPVAAGWRARRVAFADVAALQEALGCPEPLAWTLVRRGLGDPETAREFMASDGPLDPPEQMQGVTEAAERLVRAIVRGESIAIHGDYDCDGVCSTAILTLALRSAGAKVRTFLPSRFTDGYGVRVETVEMLAGEGVKLLVCVDCGTTAVDALERAVELGLDTVVCDHHLAAGARPPGILANPALGRPADDLPAAAGVVLTVVRALVPMLGENTLGPDPLEAIDLAALATVADAVPLIGQNRRLVARGLEAMRRNPRPGIKALCRAAGADHRALTARDLGYLLAPCINAAGRLRSAGEALDLVLATDEESARPLAEELWKLNTERRDVERRITDEAIAQIEASPPEIRDADAILAVGDDWHEGVVGIVASRLVERFERPAIVLSRMGDLTKGSGRSVVGVDLHDLVAGASETLTRWGGHAGAIGLQLATSDLGRFREQLAEAAEGHGAAITKARVRPVDVVVGARDLRLEVAEAINELAPFGRGNPSVRMLLPASVAEHPKRVGEGRHLALRLRSGGAHTRAIAFSQGRKADSLAEPGRHDALISLDIERFQGLVGPKVVVERMDRIGPGTPGRSGAPCAQPCDIACPARISDTTFAEMIDQPMPAVAPTPMSDPLGVRDHRGEGSGMSHIAALCGADAGVVVVVADTARRRAALEEILEPQRLGVEVGILGGGRCDRGALTERLAMAPGRTSLTMIDYDALPDVALPADTHLVLLDPPADPEQAGWALVHGAGRWMHLCWAPDEVEFARQVAEERWDVRASAAAVWRALRGGPPCALGVLAHTLLAAEPALRRPDAVARAVRALEEAGLVTRDADTLTAVSSPPTVDLLATAMAQACAQRAERAMTFLDRAATLDLRASHAEVVEAG
jgi:single-stranded-DNA-specific exonuclease